MKKISWLRRIFAFVFALAMCSSMQIMQAYAAETVENDKNIMSIEEAGFTREEAMEFLDLSEEEAEGVNFYALKATNDHVYIGSGDVHAFTEFTFTGTNGGQYFTVNGNRMKAYAAVSYVNRGNQPIEFRAYLWEYDNPYYLTNTLYTNTSYTPSSSNSEKWVTSTNWIDVTYGLDYRFTYYCNNINTGRDATCTVYLVVAVV